MTKNLKEKIDQRTNKSKGGPSVMFKKEHPFINVFWLSLEVFFFGIVAIVYGCWMLLCTPFILFVGVFSFEQSKALFRTLDMLNYFEQAVVHDDIS
ncbi:MAG: hypothetical protein ACPGXZ_00825 [Saprospiraceae bacterium]